MYLYVICLKSKAPKKMLGNCEISIGKIWNRCSFNSLTRSLWCRKTHWTHWRMAARSQSHGMRLLGRWTLRQYAHERNKWYYERVINVINVKIFGVLLETGCLQDTLSHRTKWNCQIIWPQRWNPSLWCTKISPTCKKDVQSLWKDNVVSEKMHHKITKMESCCQTHLPWVRL